MLNEQQADTSTRKTVVYEAEPTPAKLHNDRGLQLQYLEGPMGSSKSTSCIMEILMRAMRQKPHKGVRKSRWAVVRNTYGELKSTTIKTFQEWVPDSIAPIVYSMPIMCKFKQKLGDGTAMHLEVLFMALDTPEDAAKLLSLELTGAYVNEGREIPWEVVELLLSRIDRYPKVDEGGATEPGVLVDSNPPRNSHWLYRKFEADDTVRLVVQNAQGEDINVTWRKYKQPPAVYKDQITEKWVINPDAENLKHLSPNYYVNQMTLGDEHIRVNLAGEYGMSRKGTPVFAKFSELKHVSKEILQPRRGTLALMGIDFGLQPGAVIGQLSHKGLMLLDEIPATDESLEDFLDHYVLPVLRTRYQGYQIVACGDPSGGGRQSINKLTSIGVMNSKGIKTYPAITNSFIKRKEAVDWFLGRDEGFIVSKNLTHIREVMGAGYVYKEQRNAQGKVLDIPDKNEFSHVADAIQYLCLYARYGGGSLAMGVGGGVSVSDGGPPKKRHLWA
jgi:hypothetical protein